MANLPRVMIAPALLLVSAAGAQAPLAVQQTPALVAATGAVFIPKGDFAKALETAAPRGTQLAALGAVKSGADRINVDQIKRTDPSAEGPVSHDVVTEVYFVLDGGGVMETGGKILDPGPMMTDGKPTNPANIGPSKRGTQMSGGSKHHIGIGDVVIIPPGIPHRFLSLDGSVTYMVVRFNPGFEKTP
jgi:mannose-6-phosphate isomerase-like protein (cupin superfamily)